ncbi:hypothetical protein SDJN02_06570, partial [Cucurbita argyrosperma subsp. argyrosperma]
MPAPPSTSIQTISEVVELLFLLLPKTNSTSANAVGQRQQRIKEQLAPLVGSATPRQLGVRAKLMIANIIQRKNELEENPVTLSDCFCPRISC